MRKKHKIRPKYITRHFRQVFFVGHQKKKKKDLKFTFEIEIGLFRTTILAPFHFQHILAFLKVSVNGLHKFSGPRLTFQMFQKVMFNTFFQLFQDPWVISDRKLHEWRRALGVGGQSTLGFKSTV